MLSLARIALLLTCVLAPGPATSSQAVDRGVPQASIELLHRATEEVRASRSSSKASLPPAPVIQRVERQGPPRTPARTSRLFLVNRALLR